MEDWPEFSGIDSTIIREQLRDPRLFVRLLRKLVADYSDLRELANAGDAATLRALAHKLKGLSATLGITTMSALARAAEEAATAGDAIQAARLLERTASELDVLRGELSTVAAPRAAQDAAGEGEPVDLTALAALLRQQSLAALRRFDAVEGQLVRQLGVDAAQRLREHLDHMRFAAAADLIDQIR